MDSAQYYYIRFTKIFLCMTGQWFYQSMWEKIFISVSVMLIVLFQHQLQIAGVVTAFRANDTDSYMEGIASVIGTTICVVKFFNFIYNKNLMRYLLNVIMEDWKIHSESLSENEILCRNYAIARKVILGYSASLYGSMTPFMVVPAVMTAADVFGLYNSTGERQLMFRIEHVMDTNKYYYPLLIHSYFGTIGCITIALAADTLMMIYVLHVCGLCEILGQRLADFVKDSHFNADIMNIDKEQDTAYQAVKDCIILHKHIIKFVDHLEQANSTSNIVQLGLILIGITFTEFQAVVKLDNPDESLRYASFTLSIASVLLLVSWPGQQLIDHTERIFQYTANSNWYLSSIKTKKLIRIMLLRSMTPSKLTAGKLYTLDITNFGAVARTSFTYFTVLCSMQ